jgi:hypothetical protein
MPRWYLGILNGIFFVLQLLALGWLPFLLFSTRRFTASRTALVAAIFAACLLSSTMLVSISPGKALRALLRRIGLTFAWPLLFIFVSVSGAVFYLGVALICMGVVNYFSGFNDLYRLSTAGGILLFAAGFCVYALVQMIAMILGRPIELILSPLLKVISDVLRYIGLPEYRSRLVNECAQLLAGEFAESDHVIICAHSLGSVIAVDALMGFDFSSGMQQRLDLITMGSPLRRLFAWGFPQLFASPEAIFATLSDKAKNFRWLNVYRPLDVIGASLAATPSSPIKDVSTCQLLKNHTGYWDDPVVAMLVESNLRGPIPPPGRLTEKAGANWPLQLMGSYRGAWDTVWRYRSEIVKWMILVPVIALCAWKARRLIPDVRFFWSISSAPEILLVAGFAALCIGGWILRIRTVHGKFIVPFLGMLYGTLPYLNREGQATIEDDPNSAPPLRWGFMFKTLAMIVGITLALLAGIALMNRSWKTVAKPLNLVNILEFTTLDSTIYFSPDDQLSVVGERGQQSFRRGVDGCYRPSSPWQATDYDLHGSNRRGLLTLSSRGDGASRQCTLYSDKPPMKLPASYCFASAVAQSDSGKYVAVVERTGYAKDWLMIRDVAENRDLPPEEFESSFTLQIAFQSDKSLLFLSQDKLTRYSFLENGKLASSPFPSRANSRILAFATDDNDGLATIDLDGNLDLFRHDHLVSSMKASLNRSLTAPLLAINHEGDVIALAQHNYANFYDWRHFNYIDHFLNRDPAAACAQR